MLEQSGYRIMKLKGVPAPFPKALGPGFAGKLLLSINRFLILIWKRMFAYQIYIEASFVPPTDWLLRSAREVSSARISNLSGEDAR
ncbi:MAG: hypothetical protein C0404_07870 [Verrucomicrobia bacterium]|nr:hypothetical protein [Verrucomicrobiota bacterium]